MGSKIIKEGLQELEKYVKGEDYDELKLVKYIHSLCEAIVEKHFKNCPRKDELIEEAVIKVLSVAPKVDFTANAKSFLYTSVLNELRLMVKRETQATNHAPIVYDIPSPKDDGADKLEQKIMKLYNLVSSRYNFIDTDLGRVYARELCTTVFYKALAE